MADATNVTNDTVQQTVVNIWDATTQPMLNSAPFENYPLIAEDISITNDLN